MSEYQYVPTIAETAGYHELWTIANPGGTELGGAAAVAFFKKSGVDAGILRQIWALCSPTAGMNSAQFYNALRYITMVQNGDFPLSKERLENSASLDFPLPTFKDVVLTSQQNKAKAASSISSSSKTAPSWTMSLDEEAKYLQLFKTYDINSDGFISGGEAVGIFNKSGLGKESLGQIWLMADADKDGRLSVKEFCVAFHLIVCVSKKDMKLPPTLPRIFVSYLQTEKASSLANNGARQLSVPEIKVSAPVTALAAVSTSVAQQPMMSTLTDINMSDKDESQIKETLASIKDSTSKVITNANKALDKTRTVGKSLQNVIQKLVAEKIALSTAVSEAESGNAKSILKTDAILKEMSDLIAELTDLRKQLDEARSKQSNVNSDYTKALLERQKLLQQIDDTRKQIDKLMNDTRSRSAEVRSTEDARIAANALSESIPREIVSAARDITTITEELLVLRSVLSGLSENKRNLNSHSDHLHSQLRKSRIDLEMEHDLIAIKEKELDVVRNERDVLRREKEDLLKKLAEASSRPSGFDDELEAVPKAIPLTRQYTSSGDYSNSVDVRPLSMAILGFRQFNDDTKSFSVPAPAPEISAPVAAPSSSQATSGGFDDFGDDPFSSGSAPATAPASAPALTPISNGFDDADPFPSSSSNDIMPVTFEDFGSDPFTSTPSSPGQTSRPVSAGFDDFGADPFAPPFSASDKGQAQPTAGSFDESAFGAPSGAGFGDDHFAYPQQIDGYSSAFDAFGSSAAPTTFDDFNPFGDDFGPSANSHGASNGFDAAW